jgi:succinate-semialdehyde dehydrogenase / glutarate-semialdehyde dehydrogenase
MATSPLVSTSSPLTSTNLPLISTNGVPLALANENLWRTQLFVDGVWCGADDESRFDVVNPANAQVIAQVADAGASETARAIAAAERAQLIWAAKTAQERSSVLRRWYDLVCANQEDLAHILTLEQGRPLHEARAEIAYGASYIDWFAEEAKRIYGDIIAPANNNQRILVIKQPIGVVAAITPWNFPNAMLARKVAPALAAGCAVVAKPAAETPLSALALAYLAEQAGVPAGVLNIVCGTASAAIGVELTTNPIVSKLSFTGSTAVGKLLMSQGASSVKKMSLELGGNAPFMVFADADIEAAVAGALAAKFRNAGQTCVCVNRFYIHRRVYAEFTQKFIAAAAQWVIGDGFDPSVQLGPLISPKAQQKVDDLVADALNRGATLAYVAELNAHCAAGYFAPLQVLTEVAAESRLLKEEIFGPVAALVAFEDEAEVVALANSTEFGLAAYLYTQDKARIWRLAQVLEVGMLGINTGAISNAMAPFGGVKQSGWGREGSKYGIEDYLQIKYLCESFD